MGFGSGTGIGFGFGSGLGLGSGLESELPAAALVGCGRVAAALARTRRPLRWRQPLLTQLGLELGLGDLGYRV